MSPLSVEIPHIKKKRAISLADFVKATLFLREFKKVVLTKFEAKLRLPSIYAVNKVLTTRLIIRRLEFFYCFY